MKQFFQMGKIFVILILLMVLGGCASRSDLTAVSSKNVNLNNIKIDRSALKGRTSGENCQHIIIVIPTSGPATLDEALDQALEAKQANVLLDAVINWNFFYIPYIYGQECWSVEGDAYDTFE